jgi:beta-1,2-mannobiose phosphorylase / 1,2-beta-oligomannan phosphorylase
MNATHDFRLLSRKELVFRCPSQLRGMYKLSPCVWCEDGRFDLLLRVVNYSEDPSKKVARIHYGRSTDGLGFLLDADPVIGPTPDPGAFDNGGCEDPTLARVDSTYYVYYSGWNERFKRGELLLASGPDIHHLEKRGIALPSSDRAANPKEATIVRVTDGTWRLFFEYAHENKSKIGFARSNNVDGPWVVLEPLFEARPHTWDSWHLSTGPILDSNPRFPVMFYNGATQDAHWRVGWVVFDEDYSQVLARSRDPLVLPHIKRNMDDTDIAFAASALEIGGNVHLYYSVADQYCVRAVITRR